MQGQVEAERYPVECGWVVYCDHCNTKFESKRSDASYCSAKCRMGAKREHESRLKYIASLASLGRDLKRKSYDNRRSQQLYDAMLKLQSDVQDALEFFEN